MKRRNSTVLERLPLEPIILYLPLLTFIFAYIATTVLGALDMMLPGGAMQLKLFLGQLNPTVAGRIGDPVYVALLLLPLVIVPVSSVISVRMTRHLVCKSVNWERFGAIRAPSAALFTLTIVAFGYCIFKLAQFDSLIPRVLLDASASYNDKMLERANLMSELRFVFYAFVYAVIPTLAVLFFARFINFGRRFSDFIGFSMNFLVFTYFVFVLYLKSPLLILLIMLVLVVIITRANLIYIPGLVLLSLGTFISIQVLLGGTITDKQRHEAMAELTPEVSTTTDAKNSPAIPSHPAPANSSDDTPHTSVAPKRAAPAETIETSNEISVRSDKVSNNSEKIVKPALITPATVSLQEKITSAFVSTARSLVLRMASSFPFYVAVFEDPSQRCGIETNRLPMMPTPSCDLPTKVFKVMYPQIRWITGFAPAPAHVSAYGEIGFSYALLIMCLSGMALGILGFLATAGTTPLFVTLNVVSCIFGYFLTQVPFFGALTYAHGLVFFVTPLGLLFLAGLFMRRVKLNAL